MTDTLTWGDGRALAVGDPRRPAAGRAIIEAVALAGLFTAYAFLAKEIPALYAHEPWRDDPYDAFVSFSILFVPLTGLVTGLRLPSCRRAEPLATARVRDLLRASRVILMHVLTTLAAEWYSVVTQLGHGWTSGTL